MTTLKQIFIEMYGEHLGEYFFIEFRKPMFKWLQQKRVEQRSNLMRQYIGELLEELEQ